MSVYQTDTDSLYAVLQSKQGSQTYIMANTYTFNLLTGREKLRVLLGGKE